MNADPRFVSRPGGAAAVEYARDRAFAPAHVQAPTIPFPNMRPLPEVGGVVTECLWPMWNDVERPTHVYCGEPTAIGRSYCPKHCRKAFVVGGQGNGRFPIEHFQARPDAQPRRPRANPPKPIAVDFEPADEPAAAIAKAPQPKRAKLLLGAPAAIRQTPTIDLRLCHTDRERDVIALTNAGKSRSEVGRALGISKNTVCGMVARIQLRKVPE